MNDKKTPKTYIIPVSYTVSGCVSVTAMSEEDAIDAAMEHIDEMPLPKDAEYIDGSYEVDPSPELVRTFTETYGRAGIHATSSGIVSDKAHKAMEENMHGDSHDAFAGHGEDA